MRGSVWSFRFAPHCHFHRHFHCRCRRSPRHTPPGSLRITGAWCDPDHVEYHDAFWHLWTDPAAVLWSCGAQTADPFVFGYIPQIRFSHSTMAAILERAWKAASIEPTPHDLGLHARSVPQLFEELLAASSKQGFPNHTHKPMPLRHTGQPLLPWYWYCPHQP